MDLQISYEYGQSINYNQIREYLIQGDFIICIHDFPLLEEELTKFVEQIGHPILERKNNKGQAVFDVKVSTHNNAFLSIANSNLAFPLHTDCADFESIPNCIGLLCVEPDSSGQGENTFTLLKDVLDYLPNQELNKFLNKKWNFRKYSRSILSINDLITSICYDRITIESFSEVSLVERKELDKLDRIFKDLSFKKALNKGDLILFRNDRLLHGRDGFDRDSNRLVKRIRFNL